MGLVDGEQMSAMDFFEVTVDVALRELALAAARAGGSF
jgi:hypothetical protein